MDFNIFEYIEHINFTKNNTFVNQKSHSHLDQAEYNQTKENNVSFCPKEDDNNEKTLLINGSLTIFDNDKNTLKLASK